mgnify:CR=1 FL=1
MNSIFADDQSRRSTLDVSLCEERVLGSEKSFYLSSSPKRDESEAYLPSDNEWKNLLSQQDLLDEDCKLLRYEEDEEYPEDSSDSDGEGDLFLA